MKKCEKCSTVIPDEFVNLLCLKCYSEGSKVPEAPEEVKTPPETPEEPQRHNKNGVWDPDYKENEEAEDKEQWMANITQFHRGGNLLYKSQRTMYDFIKIYILRTTMEHPQWPKYIWKPNVIDVGSGSGIGANILSQEAGYVWGVDKNKGSVRFANEAFKRRRNGYYYSTQVDFAEFDVMTDTREDMRFDIVVCIEIIEHIADYKGFLRNIIEKFAKKDSRGAWTDTEFFISTPNRNHKSIQKDHPNNHWHVREWTSQEYTEVLKEFFNVVKMYKADGVVVPYETDHTPLLAHVASPKI